METLSKVPLLPALVEREQTESEEEYRENSDTDKEDCPKTLLDWISAKDQQSSLQQVAEQCRRGLEQVHSFIATKI